MSLSLLTAFVRYGLVIKPTGERHCTDLEEVGDGGGAGGGHSTLGTAAQL